MDDNPYRSPLHTASRPAWSWKKWTAALVCLVCGVILAVAIPRAVIERLDTGQYPQTLIYVIGIAGGFFFGARETLRRL